jgi:L-glutamine-phosphate cytidylyltransferase
MKIIILAAGKGERLMPLTRNTPKSLLDLANGKTLLEEQMEKMRASKAIDEIVLVVGYLAEQVEAKIKLHLQNGMKIRTLFNPFYDKSNNLVSLWTARGEMLQEDFMVANGDCLFPPKVFAGMVKDCKEGIFLATNRKTSYDDDDMKVRLDKGVILQISKEVDKSVTNAESPGLALVKGEKFRRIFVDTLEALIRDRAYLNRFWLEVFNRATANGVPVHSWSFPPNTKWQEVDFHLDIRSAKKLLHLRYDA